MPTTQTTNGIKLMTKIVDLGKTNPITAIILGLIILALFTGGGSFAATFFGQDIKIEMAIAELRKDLGSQDTYLRSAVKQETKDRIREIMQLKDDGKLLSEASIRLMIKSELQTFEDRLILRLNSN